MAFPLFKVIAWPVAIGDEHFRLDVIRVIVHVHQALNVGVSGAVAEIVSLDISFEGEVIACTATGDLVVGFEQVNGAFVIAVIREKVVFVQAFTDIVNAKVFSVYVDDRWASLLIIDA